MLTPSVSNAVVNLIIVSVLLKGVALKRRPPNSGGLSLPRGNNRAIADTAHNPNNRIATGALIYVKTRAPKAAPSHGRHCILIVALTRQARVLFLIAPMIAVSMVPPAPPAMTCEILETAEYGGQPSRFGRSAALVGAAGAGPRHSGQPELPRDHAGGVRSY